MASMRSGVGAKMAAIGGGAKYDICFFFLQKNIMARILNTCRCLIQTLALGLSRLVFSVLLQEAWFSLLEDSESGEERGGLVLLS